MPSSTARLGTRLSQLWRPVRRAVLARRRLLAALFAGVAVLFGVRATAAPPPPTVPVTVAARDLPAGTRLAAGDLTTVRFAPGTAPAGLVSSPVGRSLAAAVRRGEPITDARLLGPGLAEGHPGLVAMPVRLPDSAMAGLLRVGDRIDLLAADPQGGPPVVVTDDALVLALPPAADGLDGSASDGLPGRLVVLGVTEADVPDVADASVTRFLAFAFDR